MQLSKLNYRFLKLLFLLILTALVYVPPVSAEDVSYFNIQGIRLNMKLDQVIKIYSINNVKSSKDKFGLINGYEIIKTVNDLKIVMNFTGKKRLYRIDFSNQYRSFASNSDGLYDLIRKKYGEPTVENKGAVNGRSRNIRACWGITCERFSPTTPALKIYIEYLTGRLKMTLIDNQIFNADWKYYKDLYNDAKSGRFPKKTNPQQTFDF